MSAKIPPAAAHAVDFMRDHSSVIHRSTVLAFVFTMVLVIVYRSANDPRGILRRRVADYIAWLDAEQRAMFRAPMGLLITYAQAFVILLLLAIHGISPNAALVFGAAFVGIGPSIVIGRQVKARRAKIDGQAHGFALALGNGLKATPSIGEALKHTTDVTAVPLQDELSTALRQIRVGSTVEEALLALSARVQAPAIDVVVSALLIGRQTGGDLPRILENTAASLRELKRLEDFTDKTVRSVKQAVVASALMTIGLIALLQYLMPFLLEPMRTTTAGKMATLQLTVVYVAALYLGYRITRKSV